MSRRLLAAALVAGGLAAFAPRSSGQAAATVAVAAAEDPWARLPAILARIRPPVFPDRDFPIDRFGAVADGRTDATAAIREATEACHRAGGGRVVVPPGAFLTGPIHLKSNVDLHVSEGATLRFRRDPQAYLPVVLTRWEGVELMSYSPLVYAYEQTNVAITGKGTLDGQADAAHWWPWKGSGHPESQKPDRDRLFVDRCSMSSPRLERGIRVKTNAVRGGTIENVFVRDVQIGEVGSAIDVDMLYEEGAAGSFVPVVRNLRVERLTVDRARYAFFVRGLERSPVAGVTVRDSAFHEVAEGSRLEHVDELVLRNVVLEPATATREERR